MLAEFRSLSRREQLLTLGALVAFPVDLAALLRLVSSVVGFQRANPSQRPDASYLRIPPFLWDTRIVDVLSLVLLLYSFGVLLFLLCRRNLAWARQRDLQKRVPSPDSENLEEDMFESAFSATLTTAFTFQSVFLIWLRVFVISESGFLVMALAIMVGLLVFTSVLASTRSKSESKVATKLWKRLRRMLGRPVGEDGSPWAYRPREMSCSERLGAAFIFLIAGPILAFSWEREWMPKTLLLGGWANGPGFLLLFRAYGGLSWGLSVLLSIATAFLLIPVLWSVMVSVGVAAASVVVFLLAPTQEQPRAPGAN